MWKVVSTINRNRRIKVLGRVDSTSMYLRKYTVQYNSDCDCFIDDEGNVVLPVAWKDI